MGRSIGALVSALAVWALCFAQLAIAQPAEDPTGAGPSAQPESSDTAPIVPPIDQPPTADATRPGPWRPVEPEPKKSDWIQLTSGEWLKGEIDRLRDEKLYFDSEELDDLELDWSDIAQVRTVLPHTYRFEVAEAPTLYEHLSNRDQYEPLILTGVAQIDGESVRIEVDGEVRVFPREQLVSMVAGDGKSEFQFWSGKLSLGLAARSGNTNQSDLTGLFKLRRTTALTRFIFDYNGAYGTVEGANTTDAHSAGTSFDFFVTRRFFLRPVFADFFRDPFKNIQWRLTPGTGLGYRVFDEPKFDLDLDFGVGYQRTEFASLPTCTLDGTVIDIYSCFQQRDIPPSTAAVLVGLVFHSEPTSRLDFDGNYRFNMSVPETSDILQNLQLMLSVDLWKSLDLDVTFNWDRVENPVRESDGGLPKKDDFRLSVGFGFDF